MRGRRSNSKSEGLWHFPSRLSGVTPTARWGHDTAICKTELGRYLVVFGGWDGSRHLPDLFEYDILLQRWARPTIPEPHPAARSGHTLTRIDSVEPNKLLLIAGDGKDRSMQTVWVYDWKKRVWETRTCSSKWKVYLKDDLLVNKHFISSVSHQQALQGQYQRQARLLAQAEALARAHRSGEFVDMGEDGDEEEGESEGSESDDDDVDPAAEGEGEVVVRRPRAAVVPPRVSDGDSPTPTSPGPYLGKTTAEVSSEGIPFGTPSKNAIINKNVAVQVRMGFPATRSRHTSTFVPPQRKVFVFGGGGSSPGGAQVFSDLWTLDVGTWEWDRPKTIGHVDSVWGHSATYAQGKYIYFFGGCDEEKIANNNLLRLNTVTYVWDLLTITCEVPPRPRAAHSCVRYKSFLFILWGGDNESFFDDLHIIDLETYVAKKLSFRKPVPRCAHTSTVVDEFLYVLGGGRDESKRYKELYAIDLEYAVTKSGILDVVTARHEEIEELVHQYESGESGEENRSSSSSPTVVVQEEERSDVDLKMVARHRAGFNAYCGTTVLVDEEEEPKKKSKKSKKTPPRQQKQKKREQEKHRSKRASSRDDGSQPSSSSTQHHHEETDVPTAPDAAASSVSQVEEQHLAAPPARRSFRDLPISSWLTKLGLKRYTRLFVDHEIDLESLVCLQPEDLERMGITKLGPKKRLLVEIEKLRRKAQGDDDLSHLRRRVDQMHLSLMEVRDNVREIIARLGTAMMGPPPGFYQQYSGQHPSYYPPPPHSSSSSSSHHHGAGFRDGKGGSGGGSSSSSSRRGGGGSSSSGVSLQHRNRPSRSQGHDHSSRRGSRHGGSGGGGGAAAGGGGGHGSDSSGGHGTGRGGGGRRKRRPKKKRRPSDAHRQAASMTASNPFSGSDADDAPGSWFDISEQDEESRTRTPE